MAAKRKVAPKSRLLSVRITRELDRRIRLRRGNASELVRQAIARELRRRDE